MSDNVYMVVRPSNYVVRQNIDTVDTKYDSMISRFKEERRMKTRKTKKGRAYHLMLCLSAALLLQGCGSMQQWIVNLTHGEMAGVTTNCAVYSVDGTLGASHQICGNESDTYVYHEDAICNLDTMEKVVEADSVKFMACNEDMLYYYVQDNGGELYSYDFSKKEANLVTDAYQVVSMRANQDDVFISWKVKDEAGYITEDDTFELQYFHGKEDGINLNTWVETQEASDRTEDYKIYEFEGYEVVEDCSLDGECPQLVYVENADGFQYSCYGYNTYGKIGDKYICLGKNATYRWNGKKENLTTIIEADKANAGLSASQIGFFGNQIQMIVQYGKGTPGYQENPTRDFKSCDAFFTLEPETGECRLVYESQKGEQIAGFSYDKNCLYLLRNDGVYQYNLETGTEEEILVNEQYEGLAFEYFKDRFYIFSNPYSVGMEGQLLFEG